MSYAHKLSQQHTTGHASKVLTGIDKTQPPQTSPSHHCHCPLSSITQRPGALPRRQVCAGASLSTDIEMNNKRRLHIRCTWHTAVRAGEKASDNGRRRESCQAGFRAHPYEQTKLTETQSQRRTRRRVPHARPERWSVYVRACVCVCVCVCACVCERELVSECLE